MSAALALQAAMMAALKSDPALVALTGGRIHDGAPQGAALPYVALADAAALDWDTASEEGTEHFATLVTRSDAGGRRQALEIIGAVVAVLDEADLPLDGHRLVNLRVEAADTRRETDERTWRGRVRLRAVTERM